MEREPEIAEMITIMRDHVLDSFSQKRAVLPVSREVDNHQAFDEFINLKGIDIYGHAFFEAGYIFACNQLLELIDINVLKLEAWEGKSTKSDQADSSTESGKNIPSASLEDTKTDS